MANVSGRSFVVKIGNGATPTETFTTLHGLRGTGLNVNNSEVDVSSKDTLAGYTKLFPGGSIKTMTISGDGIFDSSSTSLARMRTVAMSTDPRVNLRIPLGDGNRAAGEFQITEWSQDGPHDGVITYRVSFKNTQDVTIEVDA